ncbi:MAG: hypothetical protein H0W50_07815 [Parachlamydiaceae bacterium]|nr:hypothetical protein [Parachlamydiaceae bacterium]
MQGRGLAIKNPIIFEIIPPPTTWDSQKVMTWVRQVCEIMQKEKIYTLNLPEVLDETRSGKRNFPFSKKIDNVRFADIIKKEQPIFSPIPYKIIGKITPSEFVKWVDYVHRKGIRKLLLVGGESHEIQYPGYSVGKGANYIKNYFEDIEIGGITIFTRPREAQRIFNKMKTGITFFCSQIIFETANLKQVISELQILCANEHLPMPKIFVSLSPASEMRDIDFIKWLGVEFPSAIYTYLTEPNSDVTNRCFSILERIIEELFDFMAHSNIDLGFNVEHVRYTNLQLAVQLIQQIKIKKEQLHL